MPGGGFGDSFAYTARLDKKKRLVLPLLAREKVGITDSVDIAVVGDSLVITPSSGREGQPVSKNCVELERGKTIGILGGMGPEATVNLYMRIIRICQREGARLNDDYPRMIICNLPTPDMIGSQSKKGELQLIGSQSNEGVLLRYLYSGVRALEKAGVDFIAVPCNTATCFMDKVGMKVPLLSIIDETVRTAKGFKRVGLLATPTTVEAGVYQRLLERGGAEVVVPTEREQGRIENCIREVLAGETTGAQRRVLKSIIKRMGVDAVVLGCTELPLILRQRDCDTPIVDSLQALAEAVVRESNGRGGAAGSTVDCGSADLGSSPSPDPCVHR